MAHHLMPDVEFFGNSHQRTQCVLVVDSSAKMSDLNNSQINQGLKLLEQELKSELATSLAVQLLVIQVTGHGEARIISEWCDAIDFVAPELEADGVTPFLGRGMDIALDKIEEQQDNYIENDISSTCPWVLLLSASEPHDWGWEDVAERFRDKIQQRQLRCFSFGTENANLKALRAFAGEHVFRLAPEGFDGLFNWLLRNMKQVSSSRVEQTHEVLPVAGWASKES